MIEVVWWMHLGTLSKISSKVGLRSGSSLQHCFISWMHSNGAWSGATVGRHMGGGFFTLRMISEQNSHLLLLSLHLIGLSKALLSCSWALWHSPFAGSPSMQYGGPLTTTSWRIIEKLYTSPLEVPLRVLVMSRKNSGAVQKSSKRKKKDLSIPPLPPINLFLIRAAGGAVV